jgi:hypothetical protein
MEKLHTVQIHTNDGIKEISVFCNDITTFDEQIDILTTSAFIGSYHPTPRTVFQALADKGIRVDALAAKPELDLRKPCHIWLSKEVNSPLAKISRIGCIELLQHFWSDSTSMEAEQEMINSIRAYFQMLDIAALYGVNMSTLALPLLGGGAQHIPYQTLLIPLINECISFLKRNHEVQKIYFIERTPRKAELIADCLKNSFRFVSNPKEEPVVDVGKKRFAFISYSSADKNIADNLCFKLESQGVKVWYAPRDVVSPYAESIVKAIEAATDFVVILSQNSVRSEHVLNEIDLAFQNLPNNIKFKPLKIDDAIFTPSFKYYLSRQHWMDASIPPLEERLNEFVKSFMDT